MMAIEPSDASLQTSLTPSYVFVLCACVRVFVLWASIYYGVLKLAVVRTHQSPHEQCACRTPAARLRRRRRAPAEELRSCR